MLSSFGFESDTPDVLQLARIAAHRRIATLRDDCCFCTWYWTIARRKALSHARGRVREQLRDDRNGYDLNPERDPDPFEHLQALQLLDQVLQNLAARQRRALILWLLHGMTYREIAAEMGITPGAVGKTLHDARGRTSAVLRGLGIR